MLRTSALAKTPLPPSLSACVRIGSYPLPLHADNGWPIGRRLQSVTALCPGCFVECMPDNQLHIPRGGVFGAAVRGTSRRHHPACVVHAAAAENDYRVWWCRCFSKLRSTAAAYRQRGYDEGRPSSPCARVLHEIPPRTERERLLVPASQTLSTQTVDLQ